MRVERTFRYTTIEEKLLMNIVIPYDTEKCWLWEGKRQKTGHGKFYWKGNETSAHRAFYKTFLDSDIEGLDIDHLCKNPPCVNPNHLEPVSSRINTLRGSSPPARNILKTVCVAGHKFEGENLAHTKKGSRRCRECSRVRWRAYYYKNRDHLNKAKNIRRRILASDEPKFELLESDPKA